MQKIYFENYDARIDRILGFLKNNGISSIEEAKEICESYGLDLFKTVKGIQMISFDDAAWAYIVGGAAALKKGEVSAQAVAGILGEGLQSFCLEGSVAEERKLGIGHGKLASMVLSEAVRCFAFLAGPESFAAAEVSHRHRPLGQQGAQGAAARHFERSGKGRGRNHFARQRLYLCEDRLRPAYRGADGSFLKRPIPRGSGRPFAATAPMRCARAWPSWSLSRWTFPFPETLPT